MAWSGIAMIEVRVLDCGCSRHVSKALFLFSPSSSSLFSSSPSSGENTCGAEKEENEALLTKFVGHTCGECHAVLLDPVARCSCALLKANGLDILHGHDML